jgi:hypothetical protein
MAFAGFLLSLLEKKKRIVLVFFLAPFTVTAALYLLMLCLGSQPYFFHKSWYLLIFGLSMLATVSLCRVQLHLPSLNRHITKTVVLASLILTISSTLLAEAPYASSRIAYWRSVTITPDQYDVAVWVRENVEIEKVDIIAHNPLKYWFFAISHRGPKTVLPRWPGGPDPDYGPWRSEARPGDIVVIYETPYIPISWRVTNLLNTREFDILFQKGPNYVLRLRDTATPATISLYKKQVLTTTLTHMQSEQVNSCNSPLGENQ